MRILALSLLILFAPVGSIAGSAEVIAQFEQAWSAWAKTNRIRKGAMIVTLNGKTVHQSAFGTDANGRFELASLSKAITAVCVDALIRSGRLRYDTRLEELLQGPIADPALARATVAQLVTHSAGIGPDSTQQTMRRWVGSTKPRHDDVAATVMNRRNQKGTPGKFYYNNENYALLGVIVETVTGEDYANACNRLAVNGRARLSRSTGGFAPWGGWTMTLNDFAAFHARNFGSRQPNGSARKSLGGGAYYGMGTFWRQSSSRYNYWHFGKHCFSGKLNAGSFSVSWQGTWGIVVAYDACVSDQSNNDLDAAFVRIVYR